MRNFILCQRLVQTATQLSRVYKSSCVSEVNFTSFEKLILNTRSPLRVRALNPQLCPDNDKVRLLGFPEPEVKVNGRDMSINIPSEANDFEVEVPYQCGKS